MTMLTIFNNLPIHRERRKHISSLPKNLVEVIVAINNREII